MDYDISEASFDELVDFYFDHPVRMDTASAWYFEAEILYNPTNNAIFFIQLFRNPNFLLQKYSRLQVDQGLWAISSPGFEGNAYNLIFEHEDIAFEIRQTIVEAMYDLFKELFVVDLVGEASAFWWTHFANAGSWNKSGMVPLVNVMFETLLRILNLDSDYCRSCALDGLRLLRHANTAEALRAYVRQHSHMDKQRRAFILKIANENPPYPT